MRGTSEKRTSSSSDISMYDPPRPEKLEPERSSESLLFGGGREDLLTTARESDDSTLTIKGVLPDGRTQLSKPSRDQLPNNPTTSPLNMRRKKASRAASLWMDSELPSYIANLSTVTPKPPVAEPHLPLEHPSLATLSEQKTPSYDPITSSTPPLKEMDPHQARLNARFASEKFIYNVLFGSDEEKKARLDARLASEKFICNVLFGSDEEMTARLDARLTSDE
jgi:hypothetical protein